MNDPVGFLPRIAHLVDARSLLNMQGRGAGGGAEREGRVEAEIQNA